MSAAHSSTAHVPVGQSGKRAHAQKISKGFGPAQAPADLFRGTLLEESSLPQGQGFCPAGAYVADLPDTRAASASKTSEDVSTELLLLIF